jgi:beta-glucosidase
MSTTETSLSGSDLIRFPDGFAWGTATASYQIEGAVDEDGRSPSIWDTYAHTPGRIADGTTGDVADDHYHRYPEDVALLSNLGVTFYRFSLAWPRLQPDGRGELNQRGVDFYSRLVDALREQNIEPWVTLYHWDLPQALEDAGGWPARDTAHRFADYASRVHDALGDRISHWTTLNEPWCSSMLGYGSGAHAPGRTDPALALQAAHHLLLGHGQAVSAMREQEPAHFYGITLNLFPVLPASDRPEDVEASRRIDGVANRLFLDPIFRGTYPDDVVEDLREISDFAHVQDGDGAAIAQPLDALGINYYARHVARATGEVPNLKAESPWLGADDVEFVERGLPKTEMGWEVDPDGLHDLLTRVQRDYGPIPLYITENGAAYADAPGSDGAVHDPDRVQFLDSHFRSAHRALADGVDLRGYFVWSLLDNFEWGHGLSKRFGLVHVDYDTLERTPKDSARWFADVTRHNSLPQA